MGRDFGALYLLGAMTQLYFSFNNNGWDSLPWLHLNAPPPRPNYKIIAVLCQELENQKSQKKKIPQ